MVPEAHIRGWRENAPWTDDLYDLGYALTHTQVDDNAVLQCFEKYMSFVVDHVPTYKEYVLNLDEKMNDKDFLTDMNALLHPDLTYDPHESYLLVKERLIDKLPGDRWH